jgi:hypothetical protein
MRHKFLIIKIKAIEEKMTQHNTKKELMIPSWKTGRDRDHAGNSASIITSTVIITIPGNIMKFLIMASAYFFENFA